MRIGDITLHIVQDDVPVPFVYHQNQFFICIENNKSYKLVVFNGTHRECKAFVDIDGVDVGKGNFVQPHTETKIDAARDERGNMRELMFVPAKVESSMNSASGTQSSTGSIVVKVASGENVEVIDNGGKRRGGLDKRYERKEGELARGQKKAFSVGTSFGRVLEPARHEDDSFRGGRSYRDEPYGGGGGGYGGYDNDRGYQRTRKRFELDGVIDVTFTVWYTDSFGFRQLPDLVDPSEWKYELGKAFPGTPVPSEPDVDLSYITGRMLKVPPAKMPDVPALNNGSLDRLIDNIANSCKIDLVRTADMNLYYCLSILLFDSESYHEIIYKAIEKELNFNERYYMSFLDQDRGFFVPLLAFSHLSRCNFIVFLGDRIQGNSESIVQFDFAPTPFPAKTFALGCLSRDKFYALKNLKEEKPKKKPKQERQGFSLSGPANRNVVVID